MITLVVVLCHQLNNIPEPVCVTEVIPKETIEMQMMAGRSDNPLPMPWTPQSCTVNAQRIVTEWLKDNPKYINWRVTQTNCVNGYNDYKA